MLFVGKFRACNTGRTTGDFYDVAGSGTDTLHIGWREPCNGAPTSSTRASATRKYDRGGK